MQALVRLMLRGSLAAAVAMAAATGCGGDDDDGSTNPGDGGDGSGGSATAGTTSTSGSAGEMQTAAGAPGGGTATGDSGAGPGGSIATGGAAPAEGGAAQGGDGSIFGGAPGSGGAGQTAAAVAKFCNTSAGDATLRLEVGQGAGKVTFTAAPGECAPADSEACSEIDAGQAVIISLYDDANDQLPLYVNPQKIVDGESWIFSVEEKGVNTTWVARTLKAGVACEDVTFSDL
jgi:hypothetical protein